MIKEPVVKFPLSSSLLAIVVLCLAISLTFPLVAAGQDIVIVRPNSTVENAIFPLVDVANGTVLTISHNTKSDKLLVQCRSTDGSAISVLAPPAQFTNSTLQLIFPAVGGPFNGQCYVNGNGGKGDSGGIGPVGPASLAMPPVDYDNTVTYSIGPPTPVVRFGGNSWTPRLGSVGPGSDPVEGTDWALFISKGDQGIAGPTGPTGGPGPAGSGSGNMLNTGASVSNGLPCYNDTTGTAIVPCAQTGLYKLASGVLTAITGGAGDMVQQDGTTTAPGPVLVVDSGVQNAAVGCPTKAATLRDSLMVELRATAANNAPATFNYCASGVKAIKDGAGADLSSGDITQYTTTTPKHNLLVYCAACNSAGGWWELVKTGGGGTSLPAQTSKTGPLVTNGTSANWRTMVGFIDNGTILAPDGTVLAELGQDNTWTGNEFHTPSAVQNITAASNQIACNSAEVSIAPDAVYVLTSTPQIIAGTAAKQRCRLVNNATLAARTVTLGDQATFASSGVTLQASQVTIPGAGRFIDLEWDATNSVWVQAGIASASGGGGGGSLDVTTKGDLQTYSTHSARLGVGANGTLLMAASGQTTGLQWYGPTWNLNLLVDTDTTLAANTDLRVPTQKAMKAYADAHRSRTLFQGVNYGGNMVFGGNVPTSAADAPAAIANAGSDVPVLNFVQNQSNRYWYGSFYAPSGYVTNSAIAITLRSMCDPANCDSAGTTNVSFSLGCKNAAGRADVATFVEFATPLAIVNSASGFETVTTGTITPNAGGLPSCTAGDRMFVKLRPDTTSLASGKPFQIVAVEFSVTGAF